MTFQSGAPLPKFSELPNFGELTGCAWDVFGKGDNLGTVNVCYSSSFVAIFFGTYWVNNDTVVNTWSGG